MIVGLLLTFLKHNWKFLAVILATLGLVGYIKTLQLERDHFKKAYTTIEVQYKNLEAHSAETQAVLTQNASDITAKYSDTLRTANTLVTENARLNSENIANAKELADVKLSLNAVRLFNASKQSTPTDSTPTAPVTGNDGSSTPATTPAVANLQQLLQVVAYNDANHLKCIAQVAEWQKFWSDFETRTNEVNQKNANQP